MSGRILNTGRLRVKIIGRNLDDLLPLLEKFPVERVDDSPELVISHGGDGSLLGAERLFPGVPKCPIRDRRNNPKCPLHSEESVLKALFAGELQEQQLDIVAAQTDDGKQLEGINDLVLSRRMVSCAIRYRISVDGQVFRPLVVSDSLVVSTRFGSTGYFQSITGGNFLDGIGLAFNNTMDGIRFAVMPANRRIRVQLLRGPAILAADNNPEVIRLSDGASLEIGLADRKTTVFGMDIFRCPECYQLRRNGI